MSKGGSTSTKVEVPQYIEDAARSNLTQADKISKLGFIPEYGPTVAAFTPLQEAAFQGTAQAAGAFGLPGGGMSQQDIMGGMPAPTTYAGGVRGYSSLPIYEQALEAFGQARPGQKRYAESFFIDPVTGLPGSNMQDPVDYTVKPTPGDLGGISVGGGGDAPYFPPVVPSVDVPFTIPPVIEGTYVDDPTDGFNDSLSSNTPVVTTDELTARLQEEERLRQEDAVRRADELAARANANPDLVGLDDKIFLQNQLEGGSSINTGSYLPGFSAEETNAAAFDPRGPSQIPVSTGTNLFTGGGADNQGNFGQVGDILGGIGDALGITDYSGQGGGLLSGLNLTGPVTPKSAAELQYEADRAPGGVHYESKGSQRAEAAQRELIQSKNDTLAQTVDTSAIKDLTQSKDASKEWLSANGYGNYDRDDAREVLQGKIADIEKSQLKQGIKDGIVKENDRYSVYVDGQLVSSEKRSSEAKTKLKNATANREETSQPLPSPSLPSPPDSTPTRGQQSAGAMEVRSLPNGTEYFVDASGNFAGLK